MSCLRAASSGRTMFPVRGRIPASPSSPLPRSRCSSSVSAWSSMWCATAMQSAPNCAAARFKNAYRSSRAAVSSDSPFSAATVRTSARPHTNGTSHAPHSA